MSELIKEYDHTWEGDYKCSAFYGYKELKQFNKFENGRMVSYGCSITYDQKGIEVSRTEPESTGFVEWDNGSPFTKDDFIQLSRS